MSKFKCSGCEYESLRKENIKRHTISKKKCCNEELIILEIKQDISCENCSKEFSTNASKIIHQKNCKSKNIVNELKEKVESLEQMLSKYITEGEQIIKKKTVARLDYKQFDNTEEDLCEYSELKKFIPLSKQIVKEVLMSVGNDDDIVEVSIDGARHTVLSADISNDDYIEMCAGDTKYYYKPTKGQLKAKDLKIHYVEFCKNLASITYEEFNCCKSCFNDNKKKKKMHSKEDTSSNENESIGKKESLRDSSSEFSNPDFD